MHKYEMLILLNSEMTDEAREAELKKYADIVMTFTAEGRVVAELDRVAGISGDVLRRMITKID